MRLIDADKLIDILNKYDHNSELWPGIERALFHIRVANTMNKEE